MKTNLIKLTRIHSRWITVVASFCAFLNGLPILSATAASEIIAETSKASIIGCYLLAKRAKVWRVRQTRNDKKVLRPKRIRAAYQAGCTRGGGNPPSSTPVPTPSATSTPANPPTIATDVVGGALSKRLLIKTHSGVALSSANCVQSKMVAWGAISNSPLYGTLADTALAQTIGLDRVYLITFNTFHGALIQNAVNDFQTCASELEWAVLDIIGVVATVPPIPSDARFSDQWALHNTGQTIPGLPPTTVNPAPDINFPEAWQIQPHINWDDVIVAVIDTGVDPHPEYATRLLAGANTYVAPAAPPDSDPQNPNLTQDNVGHGTAMAGIIAASGNDGRGIAGLAWGARILPIKITAEQDDPITPEFNDAENPTGMNIARGITAAADLGATVMNLSLGMICNTQNPECARSVVALQGALAYAAGKSVVCVAASGNTDNQMAYPAKLNECLAVGATNNNDLRWNPSGDDGSGIGPELDLVAPGTSILTTTINSSHTYSEATAPYIYLDGTSTAAAFVSGTAALIRTLNQDLSAAQVSDIIKTTVDPLYTYFLGTPFPQPADHYGAGRLNTYRAILATPYSRLIDLAPNDYAWGFKINNQGSVIGYASPNNYNPVGGFFYSKGLMQVITPTTPVPLPPPYSQVRGVDVNDRNEVIVMSTDEWIMPAAGIPTLLRWDGTNWIQLAEIPHLPGVVLTEANALNNSLQVVGNSVIDINYPPVSHAFIYDGSTRDLHPRFPVNTVSSTAHDINDGGFVVGTYRDGSGVDHGYIYDSGADVVTELSGGSNVYSLAITNEPQLSQNLILGNIGFQPVVWEWSSSSMNFVVQQLPKPCESYAYTQATAINKRGQIVGNATCSNNLSAVIWEKQNGSWIVRRLDDYLTPEQRSAGWHLSEAYGINKRGQITGVYTRDLESYVAYRFDLE